MKTVERDDSDLNREGQVKDTVESGSTDAEALSYFSLVQQAQKMANIAELVELMEETHKSKEWLVNQVKRKRQKIQLKPGMGAVAILKMCQPDFVIHLLGVLQNEEFASYDGGPSPLSQTYHWFYTDIVAGSNPTLTTDEQARKIIVLNKVIERADIFKQRDPESTIILPTGDGMAIGFSDSPEKPLKLALDVHRELSRYNKSRLEKDRIYIRIGLDTGPVYIINDLNGNENVWGPGIIMARRVMDLARQMNILATSRFANDVKMLRPEYRQILHPLGDYQIKHGEKILIYNIYGDDFGSKKSPPADKKQRSKVTEEIQQTSKKFLFNRIGLGLEVVDLKSMLTHHTYFWSFVNISKEPIDKIFYYLDGDTPISFPDMNVTIKDEDGKELEIMSLNVNKPYRKEFFVKLRKPLKPGERGRTAQLEFDWEEPDKHYIYRFASDCKIFNYKFVAPRNLDVHQKIVKINIETGEKVLAPTPAVVKYLPDKTEITWSASNISALETYRFDW